MVDVARMSQFSLDLQMSAGHGGSYLRHEFFKGVGVLVNRDLRSRFKRDLWPVQ